MKLSEVRSTLDELGMSPSKSLGQNFLIDQNMSAWIVARLGFSPGDGVIEVGPGLGALTAPLLDAGAQLVALEKDARLAGFLKKRYGERLDLRHQDALEFDTRELFPLGIRHFVGNLPYYVSSQILMHFAAQPTPLTHWILTLQRELAERIAAAPGTPDYGGLSVLLQTQYRVKLVRMLGPGLFYPVPRVDSAVLWMEVRGEGELPVHDRAALVRLVKQGFSQRRKQLRKMLGNPPFWDEFMKDLGLPETVRAETLSVDQWIELTRRLAPLPEGLAQREHEEIFDVVDENDEVVDHATRAEVHARNLLHRAVHLFVINRKGELFLQKRSMAKDRHPGCWDSSAAGHLDVGEDYRACAERELREELGVEAPLIEIGALPASEATGHEFVRVYSTEHEGPFKLPPAEVSTGGFFTRDQVRQWVQKRPKDFAPAFLECHRLLEQDSKL